MACRGTTLILPLRITALHQAVSFLIFVTIFEYYSRGVCRGFATERSEMAIRVSLYLAHLTNVSQYYNREWMSINGLGILIKYTKNLSSEMQVFWCHITDCREKDLYSLYQQHRPLFIVCCTRYLVGVLGLIMGHNGTTANSALAGIYRSKRCIRQSQHLFIYCGMFCVCSLYVLYMLRHFFCAGRNYTRNIPPSENTCEGKQIYNKPRGPTSLTQFYILKWQSMQR
jgi:hypothetical protein